MHRLGRSRSAAEWCVRGFLALAVAVIGYYSAAQSLGYLLKSDPRRAHALSPSDGRVTARLAQSLLTPTANAADRDEAERLARLALKQDPTAVAAVVTLGLAVQLKGDVTTARRAFAYAQKLSRRNLQTHLWTIEDAVSREDIPTALRHYDLALRTIRSAPDLLFPILASAISDPAIRSAMVRTLKARPVWAGGFLYYAAVHADPQSAASLFLRLSRDGDVGADARALVISRLIATRAADKAWLYYQATGSKADPSRSRDPRFVSATSTPTLFDWTMTEAGEATAKILRGDTGGILAFSAPSGQGGEVARQVQLLPPGTYQLRGVGMTDQSDRSQPYFALTCLEGRELGRIVLPRSSRPETFTGQITVPSGCPVQSLAIVLRPSDSISGVTGQVEQVQLAPAGQR